MAQEQKKSSRPSNRRRVYLYGARFAEQHFDQDWLESIDVAKLHAADKDFCLMAQAGGKSFADMCTGKFADIPSGELKRAGMMLYHPGKITFASVREKKLHEHEAASLTAHWKAFLIGKKLESGNITAKIEVDGAHAAAVALFDKKRGASRWRQRIGDLETFDVNSFSNGPLGRLLKHGFVELETLGVLPDQLPGLNLLPHPLPLAREYQNALWVAESRFFV
ncbi:MAG: hypothetical protein JWM46_262 [Candidatus Kaiserbacteria bacterium]|nr:hypothetical protein [Candidatus Kaiserbacteria bacterium]